MPAVLMMLVGRGGEGRGGEGRGGEGRGGEGGEGRGGEGRGGGKGERRRREGGWGEGGRGWGCLNPKPDTPNPKTYTLNLNNLCRGGLALAVKLAFYYMLGVCLTTA